MIFFAFVEKRKENNSEEENLYLNKNYFLFLKEKMMNTIQIIIEIVQQVHDV